MKCYRRVALAPMASNTVFSTGMKCYRRVALAPMASNTVLSTGMKGTFNSHGHTYRKMGVGFCSAACVTLLF